MTVLEHETQPSTLPSASGLRRHLFTRRDWRAMVDAGLLVDQRVELIGGEIIDMAPIGNAHAAVNDPFAELLRKAFGPGFAVRTQMPISLGGARRPSEPQPDVAVVVGSWRDYLGRTPKAQDIRLVVEVADSTLKIDRDVKGALYASAGIPEYWIINLIDNCLEIHREPTQAVYKSIAIFKPGDRITPLYAPKALIELRDCLP